MGFGNEALPLTIALGTPISGLILYLYTKSIKSNGSRVTMRISNLVCLLILGMITHFNSGKMTGLFGKVIIITFYAFREIYVSLLSTQQWAFIATSLDKTTSSYIVTFSGVVSIASAIGGFAVEQLVKIGGVQTLLLSSCLCVLACFVLGEIAFQMRPHEINVFSSPAAAAVPSDDSVVSDATGKDTASSSVRSNASADTSQTSKKKSNFMLDSWNLIWKHRILQLLLVEGVVHQLCTNMLNMMFLNGLRKEVAEDSVRAMLVGRFFASVNIVVCALQIFVLPTVLSQASLPRVLTKVPLIVMCAAALGVVRPGIISVMLGFGVIKVLEYSVMTAASEMIYVDMGHEVRYLGKELIRYFGHKMGKSAASLVLSGMVAQFDPSLGTQSLWGAGLSLCWAYSMYQLANHLWERNRNEDGFGIFKTAASYSHLSGLDKTTPTVSTDSTKFASRSVRHRKHSEDAALWTNKAARRVAVKERSFSYSVTPTTGKTGSISGADIMIGRAPNDKTQRRRGIAENELPQATNSAPVEDMVSNTNMHIDLNQQASVVKDSVSDDHLDEHEQRTGSPIDPNVLHSCSWDSRLSLSSDEGPSLDTDVRISPQEILSTHHGSCVKEKAEEAEVEGVDQVGGYGYEADAAWKQMYGGEEEENEKDVKKESDDMERPFSDRTMEGDGQARHRRSALNTYSERSQSHEGQSAVSRRVATMSFDGELEHSRPVMLRVGSMHVSLNTLEQVTISRTKRKK